MEADWSIEIGPDLPWIDASWPGFLDLEASPHAINTLPEPAKHPALREALLSVNGPTSPLYTSKCDAWPLNDPVIDPDEFSAHPQDATIGFAAYIDLLDRDPARFSSFTVVEQYVRKLTARLRQLSLTHSRIDSVVRRATTKRLQSAIVDGYGITLYVAACGPNCVAAYAAWQTALTAAVAATIAVAGSRMGE